MTMSFGSKVATSLEAPGVAATLVEMVCGVAGGITASEKDAAAGVQVVFRSNGLHCVAPTPSGGCNAADDVSRLCANSSKVIYPPFGKFGSLDKSGVQSVVAVE